MYYVFPVTFIAIAIVVLQNNELQLKLTRNRNRSMMELDQGLQEKSEKFEKEKSALKEKNKELRVELDKVHGILIGARSGSPHIDELASAPCLSGAYFLPPAPRGAMHVFKITSLAVACVHNSVSCSCMHAIFKRVAHEESMIWTSRSHTFTKEDLLQLPGLWGL